MPIVRYIFGHAPPIRSLLVYCDSHDSIFVQVGSIMTSCSHQFVPGSSVWVSVDRHTSIRYTCYVGSTMSHEGAIFGSYSVTGSTTTSTDCALTDYYYFVFACSPRKRTNSDQGAASTTPAAPAQAAERQDILSFEGSAEEVLRYTIVAKVG